MSLSGFDILCIILCIPLYLQAIANTIWWIRFKRNARITKTGVIIYRIDEGVYGR